MLIHKPQKSEVMSMASLFLFTSPPTHKRLNVSSPPHLATPQEIKSKRGKSLLTITPMID